MHRQLPTVKNVGVIHLEELSAKQSEVLAHFIRVNKLTPNTTLPVRTYAVTTNPKPDSSVTYRFSPNCEFTYLGEFDPTSEDEIHATTRELFFKQVTPSRALPAGMQCIQQNGKACLYKLKYGIYPRTSAPGYYIVNDGVDSVLGKGFSGNVCDVIGKWQTTLEAPQRLSFVRCHDKRVMKIFHPLEKGRKIDTSSEHRLMQQVPYFKVREIMQHEVGGTHTQYISQRKIIGANFTEILNPHSPKAPQTTNQRLTISILLLRAMRRDMHLRGILHRDIKPPNIIIDSDTSKECWYVKLVDLGCARHIHDKSKSYAGTPLYKAPEICADQLYSEKSDLYAATRVIGELFSDDEIETYRRHAPQNLDKTRANQELIHFQLFSYLKCDISEAQRDNLNKVLVMMTHGKPEERCSVEDAIKALQDLQLDILVSQTQPGLQQEIKQTYDIASKLAARLDMLSMKDAKPALTMDEFKSVIIDALANIGDSAQALSIFKSILAFKCLFHSTSKEDLKNSLTAMIDDRQKNFSELVVAVKSLESVHERMSKQPLSEQSVMVERALNKVKLKLIRHETFHYDLDDIHEAACSLRQSIIKVNALIRYCNQAPAIEALDESTRPRLHV